MEYAKPVLAVTDNVSDLKDLIAEAQCGEWVWSGNANGFASKIKEMASSNELQAKGNNGRKYILEYLRVEGSVEILEKHFK